AVRQALGGVKSLCQEEQLTVILVRHLNKASGGKVLYRGGGSIGIIGLVRAAFYVGPNPEESDEKVFAQIKNNLGPVQLPWGFQIKAASDGTRSICWLGEKAIPVS